MGTRGNIIIVVEDEGLIRMMAAEALTEAGFTVVEVAYAAEALVILQDQAHSIGALFTDVHMPGTMDGLQLAHHVRRIWPWIALLVASGQAQPGTAEMPLGCRFLAKPYEPQHVVTHIRELVAAE
jgi:two-component system, response regulator PdtaR